MKRIKQNSGNVHDELFHFGFLLAQSTNVPLRIEYRIIISLINDCCKQIFIISSGASLYVVSFRPAGQSGAGALLLRTGVPDGPPSVPSPLFSRFLHVGIIRPCR